MVQIAEKSLFPFTFLTKSTKVLFFLFMILFSNLIESNKTENFLASKNSENKPIKEKQLEIVDDQVSLVKRRAFSEEKATLARLTRATAFNVAFIQKNLVSKTKNLTANKATLESKSRMQLEMQAMKAIIETIKNELETNKDLPSVVVKGKPDLSYLDKRTFETEITTEEFSTSLRLSKEQVGRYTWACLHSIASAYPLVANEKHQKAIKSFIENL